MLKQRLQAKRLDNRLQATHFKPDETKKPRNNVNGVRDSVVNEFTRRRQQPMLTFNNGVIVLKWPYLWHA